VTSKPTEAKSHEATKAKKTICAIAEVAISPTMIAKAIEAKVPEANEAQEMISSCIKATLESVIQEDPLEHSKGKDTSGFPKVVPKVNAKKATEAKKHNDINMAKTPNKRLLVPRRGPGRPRSLPQARSTQLQRTRVPML
jgi:hypothetical protein